jgi:hypothetical protein
MAVGLTDPGAALAGTLSVPLVTLLMKTGVTMGHWD